MLQHEDIIVDIFLNSMLKIADQILFSDFSSFQFYFMIFCATWNIFKNY